MACGLPAKKIEEIKWLLDRPATWCTANIVYRVGGGDARVGDGSGGGGVSARFYRCSTGRDQKVVRLINTW